MALERRSPGATPRTALPESVARPILVQKFGGSSLGTPGRIKRAAKRVAASQRAGYDIVVVVSAMGDSTDRLLSLASRVAKDPAARELDQLLSTGEGVSAPLMSMALNEIGVAAVLDRNRIRLRVWERGAGITRACGTGACAALVAGHRRGLTDRRATGALDGGMLDISWHEDGHVIMIGPAALAFEGSFDAALLAD